MLRTLLIKSSLYLRCGFASFEVLIYCCVRRGRLPQASTIATSQPVVRERETQPCGACLTALPSSRAVRRRGSLADARYGLLATLTREVDQPAGGGSRGARGEPRRDLVGRAADAAERTSEPGGCSQARFELERRLPAHCARRTGASAP